MIRIIFRTTIIENARETEIEIEIEIGIEIETGMVET